MRRVGVIVGVLALLGLPVARDSIRDSTRPRSMIGPRITPSAIGAAARPTLVPP